MVFATSKIIDRAPVVKFTFHGYGGGVLCAVHRRKGDPEREEGVGQPVPLRERSWGVCNFNSKLFFVIIYLTRFS